MLLYLVPALNIFLSFSVSAELADTFARELFGTSADTLSDLTFSYSLSIACQIDWHAWSTFLKLGEQCLQIPVC